MLTLAINYSKKNKGMPVYQQLADYFKNEIRLGHLQAKNKLPSIRKLSTDLNLSRTTVETAYNILVSEGYLISRPQSGYQVCPLLIPTSSLNITSPPPKSAPSKPIRYNFSNNYIDSSTFDSALWRRFINKTLHDPAAITGYGETQGEFALRKTLAQYSYTARGVVCTSEQIIVGAGIQSLLAILLNLLPLGKKAVALEAPGFPQAEKTFTDHGWAVTKFDAENITSDLPSLLLVSPSNPYKGKALSADERRNLLAWSSLTGGYILEDDYNGEFRYFSRPVASLQGMANGERIVYLGSFSRSLIPSLRISYMVLPQNLLPAYYASANLYNQTSSTIEQLALAEFIAQGHLQRHVKKLRKLYSKKNDLLRAALLKIFAKKITILDYASGLHLRVSLHYSGTSKTIAGKALKKGVKIIPVSTETTPYPEILLSFAGIAACDIEAGVKALKEALDN
ncbi:MAG: PLP-dependent aminotransferase family protein [Acidaminococcaceae bacterium]|nr:PLP-dependent aminotransferase family protein [Acidaminococcaceae bacterium]